VGVATAVAGEPGPRASVAVAAAAEGVGTAVVVSGAAPELQPGTTKSTARAAMGNRRVTRTLRWGLGAHHSTSRIAPTVLGGTFGSFAARETAVL
jgi:hypothetical protein